MTADIVRKNRSVGWDCVPTVDELMRLRRVAVGAEPADVIIRGGRVLALHTGEILERDVIIAGRHIAAVTPVGRFTAPEIIDARGQYVAPTFIDAHIHIEYTKLTPGELARLSIPRGTTTLLADANCIGNVLGTDGFDIVGQTRTPLRIFRQVSHKVPRNPDLEVGGAIIPDEVLVDRVQDPEAATLGESSRSISTNGRPANRSPRCRPANELPGIPHGSATNRCGVISPAASATITTR